MAKEWQTPSLHICVDQLDSVAVLPTVSQTRPHCGMVEGELQRLLTPQRGRAMAGAPAVKKEAETQEETALPARAWLPFLRPKLRASDVTVSQGQITYKPFVCCGL